MPELPEVETVRAGLEAVLCGHRFVRVDQRRSDFRFPLPERFAERLTGRLVVRLDRRAKYLLVHLDQDEVLAIHLGMTGRRRLPIAPSRGVGTSVTGGSLRPLRAGPHRAPTLCRWPIRPHENNSAN